MSKTEKFRQSQTCKITSIKQFITEVEKLSGVRLKMDVSMDPKEGLIILQLGDSKTVMPNKPDGVFRVAAKNIRVASKLLLQEIKSYFRALQNFFAAGDGRATLAYVRKLA